jgi:hypothetical protein
MALTCPKCGKTNTNDIIEINYEKELYICHFCKNEFHEQDSLDYDWDLMHQRFKENISPEMCIMWRELSGSVKEQYEKDSDFGRYGFDSAFFQHFGFRHNHCTYDDLKKIKVQIERDNKINKLL